MAGKRQIDKKRDSAIEVRIGSDNDQSSITDTLSTGESLYALKENGVYKVQLADHIDPGRTNPDIPNLSQQVLTEGSSNEIVARVLLTAKYLFDENKATVEPFVASLFENCIFLTRQVLELDAMVRELSEEIWDKEIVFTQHAPSPNALSLPSIPSLDTKIHHLLVKADKAKDAMLMLYHLRFLRTGAGRPKLTELEKAIEAETQGEPQMIAAWKETSAYFRMIRNMRNASEHPKESSRVALSDFRMLPDGKVYPPLIEVHHPETPVGSSPVNDFLKLVRGSMLAHAESTLAFIRLAVLLERNPFHESVAVFPEEERRHKHVRFYRAIALDGAWRILG